MYKQFPWKDEIATSANSMAFKYFGKGFPRKLDIHVWCKFFFPDELVLMLFGAAKDSFLKTSIKEEME